MDTARDGAGRLVEHANNPAATAVVAGQYSYWARHSVISRFFSFVANRSASSEERVHCVV